MKSSLVRTLSLRFLQKKANSPLLNFTSFVSVVGIALGVAALSTVMAVMDGFETTMEKLITETSGHFIVASVEGSIETPEAAERSIKETLGSELKSITPFVGSQVMLVSNSKVNASYLEGISVPSARQKKTLIDGKWPVENSETPELALGYLIAEKLGVKPGSLIGVVSPFSERYGDRLRPRTQRFRVSGVMKLGMYNYDKRMAYTSEGAARAFFKMPTQVSGFRVTTQDPLTSYQWANVLTKALDYPLHAKDWSRLFPNLFSAVKLEKAVMFLILVFIVLVASFNIISTLVMVSKEKSPEIAIMMAMGASRSLIKSVFIRMGTTLGFVGVCLGLLLSGVLVFLIKTLPIVKLHPDIYYISELPAEIRVSNLLLVSGVTLFICWGASLFPALRTSKLSPTEELRYD